MWCSVEMISCSWNKRSLSGFLMVGWRTVILLVLEWWKSSQSPIQPLQRTNLSRYFDREVHNENPFRLISLISLLLLFLLWFLRFAFFPHMFLVDLTFQQHFYQRSFASQKEYQSFYVIICQTLSYNSKLASLRRPHILELLH